VGSTLNLEVIPFVVTETPAVDDPVWVGSRGFASRLRTSFPILAAGGATRVLILFDSRPVETQQTTISAEFGESVDSIEALFSWFGSVEWKEGFVPEVYEIAMQVLSWWQNRLRSDPPWSVAEHGQQLERAAAFLSSCRSCSTPAEIGEKLSQAMITAGREYVTKVPVTADIHIADEWAK
jgi:hypothetical protein